MAKDGGDSKPSSEAEGEGERSASASESASESASKSASKPASKSASKSAGKPGKSKRKAPTVSIDPFGAFALVTYVLVGGLLVFGFAWSLVPAVAAQNESACRSLRPTERKLTPPDFEVQDMQGNPVKLSDFEGKFVVLNFWATWCEPCTTEWPQVDQLAKRFEDRDDVVVVAMSIDEDPSKIAPYLARMSMQDTAVTVLWDPKQNVHKSFGTDKIPDTYFVGPTGKLVHTFINVRKWGSSEAYHCVDVTSRR